MWAFNENHGDNQALQVGCVVFGLLCTIRSTRVPHPSIASTAHDERTVCRRRPGCSKNRRSKGWTTCCTPPPRTTCACFYLSSTTGKNSAAARCEDTANRNVSGLARGDRKWPLNDGQIPNSRGVRVHVSTGLHSFRGDSAGVAKRSHLVSDLPPDTPDVTIRNFFASLCAVPSLGTVYAIWLHKAH